ncbi:O-succinylhomoserine sulfhydrylase [Paraburkholderia sp. SARCC-3016]|uniref:O-succinylhomoserine sulfhydrylase n=1 Tax=Paraburkholderia sp. SARCC-3016 TaxID=3058611 RepID=UPI00280A2BBB|nr:O-succinylhomoserine sulfhydrylase [Paraburkholderia sp. SARCC-3016]MDQ7979893.1 O-succinylhomoserine sulfhydrylase [Paraburkholderia sp. SARCC-3016]
MNDLSNREYGFDTAAVRSGTKRTGFNEHSEALFLTSSFCFESAAEMAERFKHSENYFTYSRFTNPTVTMFQERLAALEGGEACIATASGMSAILSVVMATLQAGDHIVSSRAIFGSTLGMFSQILGRFGITTTYVDPVDLDAWRTAVRPETKMFFVETPSNPLTELCDIEAVGEIARSVGALYVVDNTFCSPAVQRPLQHGADVVMHSATKLIDGQGRVLGGALIGTRQFLMEKVFPFVRTAGPSLSAFNAWIFLKGLETLSLRAERHSANALAVARWLEGHAAVKRVYYPGLESHPQYELARRQQYSGGSVLAFEVFGDTPEQQRDNAWRVVDATRLCSITANVGDTRTTITHPATTTHGRITPEARAQARITEALLRIAVGLEDPCDIREDLNRGLPT